MSKVLVSGQFVHPNSWQSIKNCECCKSVIHTCESDLEYDLLEDCPLWYCPLCKWKNYIEDNIDLVVIHRVLDAQIKRNGDSRGPSKTGNTADGKAIKINPRTDFGS